MKYFKNPLNNEVYAYVLDGSQDEYIPAEYIQLTEAEVDAHLTPAKHTTESLCSMIDYTADQARLKVAGDPIRTEEYKLARDEAYAFAANNYEGTVPQTVAAWVTAKRTPRQAADEIIAEAQAYTNALTGLRTVRLQAKEAVREFMLADEYENAVMTATSAIQLIESAVSGIGNAASGVQPQ